MSAKKLDSTQLDLFVLPLADVDFRDQQDTMESPFFALSKGRKTPLQFKNPKGNIDVTVSPNVSHGMANIWDADILIWAAGTINRMQTQGDKEALAELDRTRTLRFHPVDLLRSIKRGTGGKDLQELRAALDRLASTYVKTNIREHHQGGFKGSRGFSWIDGWSEITTTDAQGKERVIGFNLTLSSWLYMGVVHQRLLLSIEPEYFSLTGGYERWFYRIARKHAHGTPEGFKFTLSTLHQKSGSDAPKKAFKRDFKKLAERGGVLGYGIEWEERGRGQDPLIRIYPKPEHERNAQLAAAHDRAAIIRKANATLRDDPHRFFELANKATLERLAARYPSADLPQALARFVEMNKRRQTTVRNFEKAFEAFLVVDQRRR